MISLSKMISASLGNGIPGKKIVFPFQNWNSIYCALLSDRKIYINVYKNKIVLFLSVPGKVNKNYKGRNDSSKPHIYEQ